MDDADWHVVPGPSEDNVDGRSLLFQLLLVQFVYDRGEVFDRFVPELNEHPLLRGEAKIDTDGASAFFEKLLVHYSVSGEGRSRRKNVSRRVEALAEVLYAKYYQALAATIAEEKEEFAKLYEEIQSMNGGQ